MPDTGFIGRDETLLLLDRAFDAHPVVLLHAYAGQGKTATAVEFARWYAMTGGLGPQPVVLFTSFEQPTDLDDALNQVGQLFGPLLQANGIEWHALNRPGQRRQLVMQLLRQIPVLWIWDNVEPVAGFPAGTESQWTAAEQAELADFLKQVKLDGATKAKILLTSRRDEQAWLGGVPAAHRHAAHERGRRGRPGAEDRRGARAGPRRGDGLGAAAGLLRRQPADAADHRGPGGADGAAHRRRDRPLHPGAWLRGSSRSRTPTPAQGRDRSLGASLDYGFRHAFREDELPIIALLHLFQGTVDVDALD